MPRFRVTERSGIRYVAFYCPACNCHHQINDSWSVKEDPDADHLTIRASILVTGIIDLTDEEYEIVRSGKPFTPRPMRCHSFVTKGQIQFLDDSLHEMAGQTVDIPEWPYGDTYD